MSTTLLLTPLRIFIPSAGSEYHKYHLRISISLNGDLNFCDNLKSYLLLTSAEESDCVNDKTRSNFLPFIERAYLRVE